MSNLREILRKNLEEIFNNSPMSKKEISQKLGVTAASVTKWVKGDNSPDIEIIAKICELFNVSINSLLQVPNSEDITSTALQAKHNYDKDEIQLINNYNKLNYEGKKMLLEYAQFLTANEKYLEVTLKEKHA